jgi:hypothetical protein
MFNVVNCSLLQSKMGDNQQQHSFQQLRSCFHLPDEDQMLAISRQPRHTYAYFLQTLSLIHVPSFTQQMKSGVTQGLKSHTTLRDLLAIVYEVLSLFQEQYEQCLDSIMRSLVMPGFRDDPRKQKQRIESLKRQSNEITNYAKEVYNTVFKELLPIANTNDAIVKNTFIQWLLDSSSKVTKMISPSSVEPAFKASSSAKRRKQHDPIWDSSAHTPLEIVDQAETHLFASVLLKLLKSSLTQKNELDGMHNIVSIKIPQSRSETVTNVDGVLDGQIDMKYNELLWAITVCTTGIITICILTYLSRRLNKSGLAYIWHFNSLSLQLVIV